MNYDDLDKIMKNIIDSNKADNHEQILYILNNYETIKKDLVIVKDQIRLECLDFIYNEQMKKIIKKFLDEKFSGKSLDFILIYKTQEEITLALHDFLKAYKEDIYSSVVSYIKQRLISLNKRFKFDELALVHLIEASSGRNIITETGRDRGQVKYDSKTGKYAYADPTSASTQKRTIDGEIITDPSGGTRQESSKIILRSFPMGNDILPQSTDNIMKKLIGNLFDNLNLCIETYYSLYGDNKKIENTATLSGGGTFDFSFVINEENIPHILGIPRPYAGELNDKSIKALNKLSTEGPYLNKHSTASDLLYFILKHQNRIIEQGGLYEDTEDNNTYEILNWEKIVLKTTSFMRGDFFKSCLCIAQLNNCTEDSYVSISSDEYRSDMVSSKITQQGPEKSFKFLINSGLNNRSNKPSTRDYIFRFFRDTNDNRGRVVSSIKTGKSESIRIPNGNTSTTLFTLQKYRKLFSKGQNYALFEQPIGQGPVGGGGSDGSMSSGLFASIVQSIQNESYLRTFSIEEQADLASSIIGDFGIIPQVNDEVREMIGESEMIYTGGEDDKSYGKDPSSSANYEPPRTR